jgi:uncharacterized protein
MKNPLLALLDAWSRRGVDRKGPKSLLSTRPATVITGASDGIGLALARRFAMAGDTVVLVARRDALLVAAAEAIARDFKIAAVALPIDVNQPGAAMAIDAALAERGLHAEVLINNAGFGMSGAFATMPPADIEALVSCNIAALTRLSRHFLPAMLARNSGGLINVASLAGLTPGPFQAAYYASKAYVISLTKAMAHETSGQGVRVATLAPGPVETAFHANMDADTSFYRYAIPAPTAEAVAAATYRGFRWHRRMIVPGIPANILSLAMRLVPAFLVVPVVAWMLFPRAADAASRVRGETN